MERYLHMREMMRKQEKGRTEWEKQSIPVMCALLHNEALELQHAYDSFEALQDAEFSFIGEIGDVFHLSYRLADRIELPLSFDNLEHKVYLDDPEKLIKGLVEYSNNITTVNHPPYYMLGWNLQLIIYGNHRLCHVLGIDWYESIEYKGLRNSIKYQDWAMSNGWDQKTRMDVSKNIYTYQGGDHRFNEALVEIWPEPKKDRRYAK